jgi:dTDP-4-amino-4,6-dideoxygalactose transaminase
MTLVTKKINTPVWPSFEQDEQDAVKRVIQSGKTNYWYGDEGTSFENEFAQWCSAKHGLCVSNGTVALELSLKAVGIGCGDEVIVTPRSFLASAASVVAVGAIPVFADIDRYSGNIDPQSIKKVITKNTKGILVVHLGGWPAPMFEIMSIAKEYGLQVIEDCAQAHGAKIGGQIVGTFGSVATYSFCHDKIISTGGEGGMIITNDDAVFDHAWSLRDHGRNRERTLSDNHPFGFRWLQDRIGTNARLTEMQSAIGRCQLKKVDGWLQKRNANAHAIMNALSDNKNVTFPQPNDDVEHSYYRLTGFVKDPSKRDGIVDHLQRAGVHASVGPCTEIYREKAFCELGFGPEKSLPTAAELGAKSVVLSVHPSVEQVLPAIIDELRLVFS